MRKWIKRLTALILTLAVCTACGGQQDNPDDPGNDSADASPGGIYADVTGIDPMKTVMTVDGDQIPAELYLYWVAYNCSSLDYNLGMYNAYAGMYGELFDENGLLMWDANFTDGMTLAQYALQQSEATATFYAVVENTAKEYGVELTGEDKAGMEADLAAAMEQAGGEEAFLESLELMGITQDTFDRISAVSYLYDHLVDLVMDEGSELYLAPEGYASLAVYADHILLGNTDAETGEYLSDEEVAAKRETAEELLAQLRSADDMPALFAQLADEYSEDPGRAAYPDGYVFGEGEMVQEFEDTAFALEPGQLSDIVETDYGYHIILRKDLMEKLDKDPDTKAQLAGDYLSELLDKKMDSAVVTRDPSVENLDVAAFYNGYTEAIESRQAAAEDGTGE